MGGLGDDAETTTDVYSDGEMSQGPSNLKIGSFVDKQRLRLNCFSDLPYEFPWAEGCIYNSSHIFLGGSFPYTAPYLVDVDKWEFTRMPPMTTNWYQFSAGVVENMVFK